MKPSKPNRKRVFLDYASTTPVDKRVLKKMRKYFRRDFANPSAFYIEGKEARKVVDDARQRVATITGVKEMEVIFTGSGTESDNLAILGVLKGVEKDKTDRFNFWKENKPHVLSTVVEHPAIIEVCNEIKESGLADITLMPVLENGKIDSSQIKKYLNENTLIVSVMLANNEIGTIEPLRDVSREVKKFKNELGRGSHEPPYIHTDASQAPNFLDINLDRLGVDMMTLDGSKIYGPKGIGCLIKKSYVPMTSIIFGGGQEFKLRPSTENVPNIVGFAEALSNANTERDKNTKHATKLQIYFIEQLEKIPEAEINGTVKERMPNNINIHIKGLNSEFAVIQLDEYGLACSAMTACKGASEESQSYVVDALGNEGGGSSLRFSFGKKTTKKDIDFAIDKIQKVINLQKVGK